MKLGYFNQLQMPKPWPENAEVALYKEAMEQAIRAEAVGFDYYWQTEHHFYPEIGHSSCPELFLAALAQRFGQPALLCRPPAQGLGGQLQCRRLGLFLLEEFQRRRRRLFLLFLELGVLGRAASGRPGADGVIA